MAKNEVKTAFSPREQVEMSKKMDQQGDGKKDQVNTEKEIHKMCPNNHPLQDFKAPNDNFRCNECKNFIVKDDMFRGCPVCKHVQCGKCKFVLKCPNEHKLRMFITPKDNYGCNVCKKRFKKKTKLWGCNWFGCGECVGRA